MARDPAGAQQLLDQLAAERAAALGQPPGPGIPSVVNRRGEPYDALRLRARLAKYYHWSPREIGQLHFVSALAYMREAVLMAEAEAATVNGSGSTPPEGELTAQDAQRLGMVAQTAPSALATFDAVRASTPQPFQPFP